MNKQILTAFGMASFLAANAHAAPSAWVTQFGPLKITNETNSTLLRDTKDASTVWVLPPTGGKIEFQNFFASGSVGLCPGLKSTIVASNTLDARIATIAESLVKLEPDLAAAEKELRDATTALGKLETGDLTTILSLEGQIEALQEKNTEVISQLETCVTSCEILMNEYQSNKDRIKVLQKTYDEISASNRETMRVYKLAKARKEAAEEDYLNVGKRYDTLLDRVNTLMTTVSNSFSSKGKLEGGNALVNYESGWQANILALEKKYPDYDFNAIPTRNARIHANIIGAGDKVSYYESLPAVLDYTINGHNYMPWGNEGTDNGEQSGIPSTISGNFRLSLLGACPMVQSDFFSGTNWNPEVNKNGLPLFGISTTYEYPVAYKFKVTASYNLYKFYDLIKKTGTKSGFFSSKSYSSVVENRLEKDSFNIDWFVEDPDSIYTETMRQQITEDLKRQLTERVLVTMAQPIYNGASATPLPGGVPPETGSIVLANGLQQTCGFSVYCQAGSWILRGAQAIWGSSSAETRFQQQWDRTASETWSAETVRFRGAATGFSKK